MSFGNDPWSDRIAKIQDDGPRRALLAEIGLWRASRLTDIQAARQATYALSRLHWLLREKEAAEREARQLLSLCQTPPRASSEDIAAARGWLESLGAKAPKVVPGPRERQQSKGKRRNERPGRNNERKKEPRAKESGPSRVDQALQMGDAGDLSGALKVLRGKRGGKVDLVRVWVHLRRALSSDDDATLRQELEQLAGRIRGQLGPGALDVIVEPKGKGEPKKKKDRPTKETPEAKPDEPKKPTARELAQQRTDALKAALTAEAAPDVEALKASLAEWPRLWRAIASAERWDLDEARIEVLLRAVDAAKDDDRTIPGGTSLLIRLAAGGSEMAKTLLSTEPTSARYGGVGSEAVVALAEAAHADGWVVDRVLRGPTRKESDRHSVLRTVGSAMDGLWRVLLKKGESRAELWYIAELPAEGRAGVPMLLLEDHARVVALPIEPDLLGWYGELQAPEAIGWTGDEADAVRTALSALGPA